MSRLKDIAEQIGKESQPPVHLWKPENIGEIDIRIDAQGFWFHEGDPISRATLVKLFASILWFENGQHYLVTPVEKLAIEVADSAYLIHQMEYVKEQGQQTWVAVTNTHEQIIVSAENPVELRIYQAQWVPYVNVRYDLWARVNRSVYYQWVSAAVDASASDSVGDESEPKSLELKPKEFISRETIPKETTPKKTKALVLTSQGYEFEVARSQPDVIDE